MYFVIYDKNDNIIAYIDNIDDLALFVNRRKKQLKYKFKTRNCVYIQDKHLLKIYKFI